MPTLYVVATPIGNLSDISERALEILRRVDLILCEDTRHTQKLLNHFNIKTKTLSYHQHSKLKKINYILELFQQGKDLALVSDAGTPGISDPGNKLIKTIATRYHSHGRISKYPDIKITSVPGPSAVTAVASISGFPMDKFLFLGFPPAKRKRKKFFNEVLKSQYPVILYESPHRILKTLNELNEISTYRNIKISVVVCRELTKLHETTYRGTIDEVINQLGKDRTGEKIKGEFVVIVEGRK